MNYDLEPWLGDSDPLSFSREDVETYYDLGILRAMFGRYADLSERGQAKEAHLQMLDEAYGAET